MNNQVLEHTLIKLADLSSHSYDYYSIKEKYYQPRTYRPSEFHEFVEDLTERALRIKLSLIIHALDERQLADLIRKIDHPLLVFRTQGSDVHPLIIYPHTDGEPAGLQIFEDGEEEVEEPLQLIDEFFVYQDDAHHSRNNKVLVVTALPLQHLVSDRTHDYDKKRHLTPFDRLMRLLGNERKDIFYIYIYAIVVGLINLSLPLGIQALIGLVSGGLIFSSVIILIAIIIIGTLLSGGLQIMQITLVEVLQRRVFAKASLEFAYRIPRLHLETLMHHYPPELMNRFFDVPTVQKGLPKLLIDLLAAVMQIFFGVILLSFYHPFFIFFGVVLIAFLFIMFRLTGPRGLDAALHVSKYKYKLGNWFQEMARTLVPFKMAGKSNMPIKKTDDYVNNYLHYRKAYFSVLLTQFSWMIIFKTAITGGLLILGTMLVVDRQISLGQFVASEIVIITIVAAVEKIVLNIDTVYDLLVGVEKIGNVTDLPLEVSGDASYKPADGQAIELELYDVSYKLPQLTHYALRNVSVTLQAGKVYVLTGTRGSGKTVLVKLICGLLPSFEGNITFNHVSIRDMENGSLRSLVGENLINDSVFDGSILDNMTMGKPNITFSEVVEVAHALKIDKSVNALPEGYATVIRSGESVISGGLEYRITLARAILGKPRLLIVNDLLHVFTRHEKLELLSYLTRPDHHWTLLFVSEDPMIIASCEKVLSLRKTQLSVFDSDRYIPE